MADPEEFAIAADFPQATREDWRKLVDGVLKGTPFERLLSTTYDGLRIEPLAARRTDARPIAARPGAVPWQVLARIDHPDPARANETALRELENGASGLALVCAGAVGDHGFALPTSADAIARALDGVHLTAGIALEIDLPPDAEAAVGAVLAKAHASSPGATDLRFGLDPLGAMALAGNATVRTWSESASRFAQRLATWAQQSPRSRFAAADGRVIHNAGGSEAQELAFVLAVALAYLRALEEQGIALETARRAIFFRISADADQFLTIAKFRALRKLWTRVEVSCGLGAEPVFISAETAWRMMSQRDAHVNILRATVAVFAAALGGADAITVLPFTAARGLADRFARRIARNTQLVLLEESHLDKVADPGAGAGAIEDLTDQLCRAAWDLFQQIEVAGGAAGALESGLIQEKVGAARARRAAAVARRGDALTGVSIFPNLYEAEATVEAVAKQNNSPAPTALWPIRLAEPFEALRDAADRILAASGSRPKVFLANLGTPADFTARSTFAKNFFEAGGIEAVGDESPGRPALPAAYKTSGAALACLCSSDKVYETEAAAAAAALKTAGARHIYLAGRPGEREAALKAAGVQSFVYEGCDALATLRDAYDILG